MQGTTTFPYKQVLLVHREETNIETLRTHLHHLDFTTVMTAPTAAEALELLYSDKPDLVLVEQQLNGRLNGLQLAEVILQSAIPTLVLVGTEDELPASSAQQLLAFLPYPINKIKLKKAIQQLKAAQLKEVSGKEVQCQKNHFFIRVNNRLQRIQVSAIEWIESDGNYCVIHYEARRFMLKISLRRVLQELSRQFFAQVHKKYIVPLDKIQHIDLLEGKIYLEQQALPLGRRYRENFLEQINLLK